MAQRAVSFTEAKAHTKRLLELFGEQQKAETKLPMDNIVFDRLGEIPLLEMLMNLNVVTKEHVNGTVYDKRNFQMVMRIIDGRVLMRDDNMQERPDAYAWKTEKVLEAKNKKPIGMHSTEGALNYAAMIGTIREQKERELFTDLLVNWSKDLLVIHTEAEHRMVIIVTEEMIIKHGITAVYNSYDIAWPAKGVTSVEPTPIKVGDALVIEQCSFGPAVYVVGRDEHDLTHVEGHI